MSKGKNTTENFIRDMSLIHGDKYNYNKVKYDGANKKVIITCPVHGDFPQSPSGHRRGYGCTLCGNKKKSTDEFIKIARELHKDRYDYSLVEYAGTDKKIKIICELHGEFVQTPYNHLHGANCPKCGKISGGLAYVFYTAGVCK